MKIKFILGGFSPEQVRYIGKSRRAFSNIAKAEEFASLRGKASLNAKTISVQFGRIPSWYQAIREGMINPPSGNNVWREVETKYGTKKITTGIYSVEKPDCYFSDNVESNEVEATLYCPGSLTEHDCDKISRNLTNCTFNLLPLVMSSLIAKTKAYFLRESHVKTTMKTDGIVIELSFDDTKSTSCPLCGDGKPTRKIPNGIHVCESCFSGLPHCEHCAVVMINNGTSKLCPDCKKKAVKCSKCGTKFIARTSKEKKIGKCASCYEKSRGVVQNYSYNPVIPQFLDIRGKRVVSYRDNFANGVEPKLFFGFENEMYVKKPLHENMDKILEDVGLFVYYKDDSSVRKSAGSDCNNGVEMVSYPMTWEFFNKHLYDGLQTIDNKVLTDGNCGLHVHFSRDALSIPQMINVVKFTMDNKPYMIRRSGRGGENSFCKYSVDMMTGLKRINDINQTFGSRWVWNFNKPATIEFRGFSGCSSTSELRAKLIFILSVLEAGKNGTITIEKIETIERTF
jgi:hypothetical protein